MKVRAVSMLVLALVGCEGESEVTVEQRAQVAALVDSHDKQVADKLDRLQQAVVGQLGPVGPLVPRPDLGPCPELASAAEALEAPPLPDLTAETAKEAEAELVELSGLAATPAFTTSHLLVPSYEMVITPEVDPELKGFRPGVGRAWLAVVDVATEEIVCVGTSSVQVSTSDVQIHRRPVPGSLSEPERIKMMDENLRLAQEQVVGAFRRQLSDLASEAMARSGPFDEALATEHPIDEEQARRLLKR